MQNFRVLWWNTGLCPPRKRSRTYAKAAPLAEIALQELLSGNEYDLVCLGETDAETGSALWKSSFPAAYDFMPVDSVDARLKFSISIFWNTQSLAGVLLQTEIDRIAGRQEKVAARLDLILRDNTPIRAYMVHWPSRLYFNEETSKRSDVALSLRRLIDQDMDFNEDAHVLVFGDFNDNPYDRSIRINLRATRDVAMTARDPRLLYNPFWKHLVHQGSYSSSTYPESMIGSYLHRGNRQSHRWHILDQFLVSSSFLGPSSWHLNEAQTCILADPALHGLSLETDKVFDHYPVVACFEKGENP